MVEKLNYLTKGLIGLFLIFLTLALMAVSFSILRSAVKEGADRPSFRGGQERAYAVPVSKFTSRNFLPKISSYGEVASWNSLELRSSVGGRIDFVSENFRDGAVVNKGELLFLNKNRNLVFQEITGSFFISYQSIDPLSSQCC